MKVKTARWMCGHSSGDGSTFSSVIFVPKPNQEMSKQRSSMREKQ
jgi:hypothetical protein